MLLQPIKFFPLKKIQILCNVPQFTGVCIGWIIYEFVDSHWLHSVFVTHGSSVNYDNYLNPHSTNSLVVMLLPCMVRLRTEMHLSYSSLSRSIRLAMEHAISLQRDLENKTGQQKRLNLLHIVTTDWPMAWKNIYTNHTERKCKQNIIKMHGSCK